MAQQFTIEEVISFADVMTEKGYYNKTSNRKRKLALNNIVSILGPEEQSPQYILQNLDEIIKRWAVATKATNTAIVTNKSHIKGLLTDYLKYQENPTSFKPRTRKPRIGNTKSKNIKPIGDYENTEKPIDKTPDERTEENKRGVVSKDLSFNINIQIHISADASSDQIETIFASMAKNLGIKDLDE